MQRYCRVAIDSPVLALDRPFDYAIPERLLGRLTVGSVVRVVLHGRNMRAFVTELVDDPAVTDPRPVRSVVAQDPVFAPDELALGRWAADRYVAALGHVLHDAVPGRFSAPVAQERNEAPVPPATRPRWLGAELSEVIARNASACVFPPTVRDEPDVAAHIAGEAAAAGGRTLIVCPRVDVATDVAARIPGAVVLHGDERPRERARAWAAARDGEAQVVVGGRSALFVPMPGLRAICVLSVHDRSLKAERAPRLHGVVVARRRAVQSGAAFVASSPAPPLEFAAGDGVEWITGERSDIRTEIARPRGGPVTPRLVEALRWAIGTNHDALVFVGRRGNTLRLRCQDCGWTPTCARCGSGLSEGGDAGRLVCRVCGEPAPAPVTCATCGGALVARGWGHERVARALEGSGLGVPVVRIVRGEVPVERPRPAVLVGTLAAAHAAVDVACVCVADLDQQLLRPDFRAAEQALQTLHELAGALRPGGRFLVQTREPEHHAVQAFARRSYRYFFDREIGFRRQTGYPPFGAVVRVDMTGDAVDDLRATVKGNGGDVVGVVDRAGRSSALVRAPSLDPLLGPLREFAGAHARTRIDVDPVEVI